MKIKSYTALKQNESNDNTVIIILFTNGPQ